MVDDLALLVGLDPVHEVAHLGVHARAERPTQICSFNNDYYKVRLNSLRG